LTDQIQKVGHVTHASPPGVGRHALVFAAEQDSGGLGSRRATAAIAGGVYRVVPNASAGGDVFRTLRDATARGGLSVDGTRTGLFEKAGGQPVPRRSWFRHSAKRVTDGFTPDGRGSHYPVHLLLEVSEIRPVVGRAAEVGQRLILSGDWIRRHCRHGFPVNPPLTRRHDQYR